MTITQLPGWYDQIAPYIQQLSGIIPRLINPHLDAQRMLQQQIAQDPRILQQLADLNANSPGIIDKLGFGNISNQIGKLPESAAQKTQKTKDQAIANLSPTQQKEYLANLIGISTDEELAVRGLQKKNLELNIREGEQNLSEGEIKRAEAERIQGLEKLYGDWSKTKGKFNLYSERRSGTVPEWMAEAITSSPKISRQYDQDAQDYFREKELELSRARLAIQRTNDRQTFEEWKRKSIQDQAERMAYRAGSTNIAGFAQLIENPQLQSGFKQYDKTQLAEFAKQNPQLAPAIEAFNSQGEVDEKAKQGVYRELRIAHTQARIAADKFRNGKGSELEVQSAVEEYNKRVSEALGTGIDAGMLSWGVDPNARVNKTNLIPGDSKDTRPRLMLVDPQSGQTTGDGEKSFEIPNPTKSPEFQQQLGMVIRDLVASSPEDRKKKLDQLAKDNSPAGKQAYAEITSKVKSGGLQVAGDIKPGKAETKEPVQKPSDKSSGGNSQIKDKKASELSQYITTIKGFKRDEDKKRYLEQIKNEVSPGDLERIRSIAGVR